MATITSMPSVCTSSASTASAAWSLTAESFLEQSIPGYRILSGIIKGYFHIDVSSLLVYLIPLAAIFALWNYFYDPVEALIRRYGVVTAEIRSDDDMYNHFIYWMSQQKFSADTLSFIASTSINVGTGRQHNEDSDDEDAFEDENLELAEDDFEGYWAKLRIRDRMRPLYFTPSDGSHGFRYAGHWINMTRETSDKESGGYFSSSRRETIYLSCLGRNSQIIKDLLREAQKASAERDGPKTIIYRKADYDDWQRIMARPPRALSTVVLDTTLKNAVVQDMREYLSPLTKRWYANRGIPYRRGYLLYGPPGTGKTSLCVALAGTFGLNIYVVSLNSKSLTEETLGDLFSRLPTRCIVLLEDVDATGITKNRAQATDDQTEKKPGDTSDAEKGLSFSGLLNVIDGVASGEGRILIMTTNHAESLDSALLRPGRVDMSIGFENATVETASELFRSTYQSRDDDFSQASRLSAKTQERKRRKFTESELDVLAGKFARIIPSGEFSPADIQGYLLKYKSEPVEAAEHVSEWISKTRAEKERLKTARLESSKPKPKPTIEVSSAEIMTPPSTPA